MVKTVGKTVGNVVSTGKLVRVVVSFTDKGKVKVVKSKGNIEGFTEKNVRVGENNGDFKRLVNLDILGEFINFENKMFTKWFIAENENEIKSEIREMMLEIGRILRAEEAKFMENILEMKRSVRAEGMKYIVEKEKNPNERRGRPKGAKNKAKTVEAVVVENGENQKETKKRVGRPKSTTKVKAAEVENTEIKKEAKKRVGRPKGSTNKAKVEEVENPEVKKEAKKRVGRPKGSKNKTSNVVEFQKESKGRVGRPKGTKNKSPEIIDIDDEDLVSASKEEREKIIENLSEIENVNTVKTKEIVSGADVFEAKASTKRKPGRPRNIKSKEKSVFSKKELENTPFVEA